MTKPLEIAMTGSSGLIGSALAEAVVENGGAVVRLVRRPARADDEVQWLPDQGLVGDLGPLEGLDGLVHLAGENIASGRWTARRKREIRESRVGGTARLIESLGKLEQPPKCFLCASAVGYYGDRGDQEVDESADAGNGFLADLCVDWEAAAATAAATCERVVISRFGIVLSSSGGALDRLLPIFKLGLGGRLGSGGHYMSWITLQDVAGALVHLLASESCDGVYNLVSPEPVTNSAFTDALAKALRRPAMVPVPSFALRLALGEMADEMLLASQRVVPSRLVDAGFEHRHSDLSTALTAIVG